MCVASNFATTVCLAESIRIKPFRTRQPAYTTRPSRNRKTLCCPSLWCNIAKNRITSPSQKSHRSRRRKEEFKSAIRSPRTARSETLPRRRPALRHATPGQLCHVMEASPRLCWSRTCRTNLHHLDAPSRANFRILSTLLSFQTTALLLSETSIFPHSYSRRASIPLPTVYDCATRNSCFTPQPDSVFASLSQPVPLQKNQHSESSSCAVGRSYYSFIPASPTSPVPRLSHIRITRLAHVDLPIILGSSHRQSAATT